MRGGAAVAVLAAAGLLPQTAPAEAQAAAARDEFAHLPDTIVLTGTLRDFRAHGKPGGHPDFQRYNTGHIVGLVQDQLDRDGKPVLKSTSGYKVDTEYRDRQGNNINPSMYDGSKGDRAGKLSTHKGTAITSAESFRQWYRDVPGVNMSAAYPIELRREPGTAKYVFHAHDIDSTPEIEGFFPADGQLFNDMNSQYKHNFYLTYELETEFVYHRGAGERFTFYGDDDVWVFIDGKLVIDLGGVHGAVSQTIELDRLDWLQDGRTYDLKLFFAERHTTRSNFRVETTMQLRTIDLPATAGLYD